VVFVLTQRGVAGCAGVRHVCEIGFVAIRGGVLGVLMCGVTSRSLDFARDDSLRSEAAEQCSGESPPKRLRRLILESFNLRLNRWLQQLRRAPQRQRPLPVFARLT
jgi:hypothetical protein